MTEERKKIYVKINELIEKRTKELIQLFPTDAHTNVILESGIEVDQTLAEKLFASTEEK